jgi:hypothetical protein
LLRRSVAVGNFDYAFAFKKGATTQHKARLERTVNMRIGRIMGKK